jgi:hypothetical protein
MSVQKSSIEFLLLLSIVLVLSGLFIATMSVAWRGANSEAYVDGFKKYSSTNGVDDVDAVREKDMAVSVVKVEL